MTRVFVYGTLRANGSAHDLMKGSSFIGHARTTTDYQLYDLGYFPGMVRAENSRGNGVCGEVYECPPEAIKAMDLYEGVDSGLFKRVEVELIDGGKAEAYLFAGRRSRFSPLIEGGKWDGVQKKWC